MESPSRRNNKDRRLPARVGPELADAREGSAGDHLDHEFGSPRLPQTLEAVILHSPDDLDGEFRAIPNLPKEGARLEVHGAAPRLGRGFSIAGAVPAGEDSSPELNDSEEYNEEFYRWKLG